MRKSKQTVTDGPKVTKQYQYNIGVELTESVLTFDLARPLAVILISRDFRQSEKCEIARKR